MTLRAKLMEAGGLVFLVLCGVGFFSYWWTLREDENHRWVAHSYTVLEQLSSLVADVNALEAHARDYTLTGNSFYQTSYETMLIRVEADLNQVGALTANNSEKQEIVKLRTLVSSRLPGFPERERRINEPQGASNEALSLEEVFQRTRTGIAAIDEEERRLLTQRLRSADAGSGQMKAIVLLGNVLAILFLACGAYIIRQEMGRRNKAEERLRASEERFRLKNAELEAANKELDAFSYSVAHDLRAPLRAIDGFSLALLEDYKDQIPAGAKGYLDRVRSGASRMGQLIDDLLKLARISRQQIERGQIDLSSLAVEIAAQLQVSNPDRQIRCMITPGVWVSGDRSLLRIVLENLLGNAWKFTSKRPDAKVELGVQNGAGERVVYVRDNGSGFDMQYSDKLFGVFQRLHRDTEFPGTGVGLATVQRIISRHGGRIWAEAAPDEGATFYFVV